MRTLFPSGVWEKACTTMLESYRGLRKFFRRSIITDIRRKTFSPRRSRRTRRPDNERTSNPEKNVFFLRALRVLRGENYLLLFGGGVAALGLCGEYFFTFFSNLRARLTTACAENIAYRFDYVHNVGLRHFGIDRQGNNPFKDSTCVRKVLRFVPERLAIIGMEVERDKMN